MIFLNKMEHIVIEIYEQLFIYRQFGGVRAMNIHSRYTQFKKCFYERRNDRLLNEKKCLSYNYIQLSYY